MSAKEAKSTSNNNKKKVIGKEMLVKPIEIPATTAAVVKKSTSKVPISNDSDIVTPINKKSESKKELNTTVTPKKGGKKALYESLQEEAVATAVKLEGVTSPSVSMHLKKVYVNPKVERVYRIIHKSTGALGGNGTTGAIYGELTMHSMQKILNAMVEKCEMTSSSMFIDVGAGLGKPNFHAAQDPIVRLSIGVELETIRWQLSMVNLLNVLVETSGSNSELGNVKSKKLHGNTNFIAGDIDTACSLDPFTHIYMYDLGFPPPLQQSIANKFNTSVHAKYLISYRPPARVINKYGYSVEFIHQMPTSMHGSGESHTAYFYKRINIDDKKFNTTNSTQLSVPSRAWITGETDTQVWCDNMFLQCATDALGDIDKLKNNVSEINQQHLHSERPKRDRKPPKQWG